MSQLHSYPNIYALGHKAVANLLDVPVIVQEKVDGSQFSFGVDADRKLHVRSKGAVIDPDNPPKMFAKAVETVKRLAAEPCLVPGWTYRGEVLDKPKHNVLTYSRVPKGNIILFDIDAEYGFLGHDVVALCAGIIGLEVVPTLFDGKIDNAAQVQAFLDRESILGGTKIEGVVIKPIEYNLFGADKKVLMGKFVSEAFKEKHKLVAYGEPSKKDFVETLAVAYRTEARWLKAIQHLRDNGQLTDSPKDIGPLMKEIPEDIFSDSAEEIKEALFNWAWPMIRRRVADGFPEFYKKYLLYRHFEQAAA